jgi:flagellar motor switch protein FliN
MMAEHDQGAANQPAADGAVKAYPVEIPPLDEDRPAAQDIARERDASLAMILDIPVNIRVELGQARLSIQEILRLGTGSVVELNRLAGQPADIVANGKLIGQGDIVVVDDKLGVRITKLVGPEQRVKNL